MSGRVLISHPVGNANVRQALLALDERGLLEEFWTTIRWEENCALHALLPPTLKAELKRRSYPELPAQKVHTRPWREAGRLLAQRAGLRRWTQHNEGVFSVAKVGYALDRAVAARVERVAPNTVYAYEDSALETFRAAKKLGITTVYELPTAYWKYKHELLLEEKELCPEWAETITCGEDRGEKTDRKEAELELADRILVPCRYLIETLPASLRRGTKLQVCPYGAPSTVARQTPEKNSSQQISKNLRVLFVGALTQGKGLAYLLRALRRVEAQVEFTLIGRRVGRCAELEAALKRYRYLPSLPHAQVLEEMQRHDVLVFPSLTEGFGLVILEALSRGLAVITTCNTGAPEVIRDGREGFLVPIRSEDAIAEKLELLAADRGLVEAMSQAALERARACSWSQYRERLVSLLQPALQIAEGVVCE